MPVRAPSISEAVNSRRIQAVAVAPLTEQQQALPKQILDSAKSV
jgi:hypothetical protein